MPLPPIDDPAPFAEAARALLGGQAGCHGLAGRVRSRSALTLLGQEEEQFHFVGELADGFWKRFEVTTDMDENDGMAMSFGAGTVEVPFPPPLLGRFADAPGEVSILGALLELFARDTETDFVATDGERYRWERTLQVRRSLFGRMRENVLRVWFTADRRPVEWSFRTAIPVRTEGVSLHGVDARLELDTDGMPRAERLVAVASWGPVSLHVDRTIDYTAGPPCGGGG